MKYLVLIARLVIGGVFVYASIHKILDPAGFAQAVRNYQMISPHYSNLIAVTLPWIEFCAGLFLILGIRTKASALMVAGMMVVFSVALSHAYFTGLDIGCGCFSTNPSPSDKITPLTLIRDLSLLPAALFVLFADRGYFSVAGMLRPGLQDGTA